MSNSRGLRALPPPEEEPEEVSIDAALRRASGRTKASETATVEKAQLGVRVPQELKERALKASHRYASHGGPAKFNEFVAEALEREIRRIEETFNGGQPIGAPIEIDDA